VRVMSGGVQAESNLDTADRERFEFRLANGAVVAGHNVHNGPAAPHPRITYMLSPASYMLVNKLFPRTLSLLRTGNEELAGPHYFQIVGDRILAANAFSLLGLSKATTSFSFMANDLGACPLTHVSSSVAPRLRNPERSRIEAGFYGADVLELVLDSPENTLWQPTSLCHNTQKTFRCETTAQRISVPRPTFFLLMCNPITSAVRGMSMRWIMINRKFWAF
jgi:hypothetical protein